MTTLQARWYFDVISPFAYLHWKRLSMLPKHVSIEYIPVLFAGLLKAWRTKGPAELPAKRVHTYRQCVWLAQQYGVPFQMPPRHPFNPLAVLRLLIARGCRHDDIDRAFDFIWREGRDPEAEWPALHAALGVNDPQPLVAAPEVKAALARNTEEAIAKGIWGVPTLELRGELFWGVDTLEWTNAFIADPALFASDAMQRATHCAPGVVRK